MSVLLDKMTSQQIQDIIQQWDMAKAHASSAGDIILLMRYAAGITKLEQELEDRELFGLEPNLTPEMAARSVDAQMVLDLMVPKTDTIGLVLSVDSNLGTPLKTLQALRQSYFAWQAVKEKKGNTPEVRRLEIYYSQNLNQYMQQVKAELNQIARMDQSKLLVQQREALRQYEKFLSNQTTGNAVLFGVLNGFTFGLVDIAAEINPRNNGSMDLLQYGTTPQFVKGLHPTAYGIGSFAGQMLSYASINSLIANSPALQGMSNKLVGWLVKHGFAEVTAERTGRLVLGRLTDLPADLVNAARQADDVGEFLLNLSASTAQGLVADLFADLALEGVTELWHRVRGDIAEFETQTQKNNPVSQQDLDFAQDVGEISKGITQIEYTPSSGVILKANPDKTTTILGSFDMDMRSIVNEMGNVKSTDFGGNKGGFNVLNVPDELYNQDTFWDLYNKPWLDEAIRRGDDIVLATKPEGKVLQSLDKVTGKWGPSGFAKEYQYLIKKGYHYDAITNRMVRKRGD